MQIHKRDAMPACAGLWPLPASAVNLQESVKRFLPFVAAGGAMLVRTALLLGTKTLAATVATKQGSVNIAAHQVRAAACKQLGSASG